MSVQDKYKHLATVEKAKQSFEKDLLSLERLGQKSEYLYQNLLHHLKHMDEVLRAEKAWFLLEKVQRLKALVERRYEGLGYNQKDFDIYYRYVDKLTDFAKDEIVSPLIIPNVERLVEQRFRQRLKSKRDQFLTFTCGSRSYLIRARPYKKIRNFRPEKKILLKTPGGQIFLGPLLSELSAAEEEMLDDYFILLFMGEKRSYAYYANRLEDRIYMSRKQLRRLIQPTRLPHADIHGIATLRGRDYFVLKS